MNRILRFIPEGAPGGECIEYEADPRHADILAAQFGFTDTSKTVATPGVRTKMTESQLEPLKDKDAAFYRSACMRLGYSFQWTGLSSSTWPRGALAVWLCQPKDTARS